MNIVCIIQARTGSSRLPGKVLLNLEGKPVLLRVIDRVLESDRINRVVVATTISPEDQQICDLVEGYDDSVSVFRGSQDDVLERYYLAAKEAGADAVVRITSDCPLIDPQVIDKVIGAFLKEKKDYTANILGKRTYPQGLDTEVFTFKALEEMHNKAEEKEDREHVTLYLRKRPEEFQCLNVENEKDLSFHRWTLDEQADYDLIKEIYGELYRKNPHFRMKDVVELFERRPELLKINQNVKQKLFQY